MIKTITLAVIMICVIVLVDTARILAVYPTPSISHQLVFRVLSNELVKRGHEVIVITPDPEYSKGNAPENLTEIDIHNVSYSFYRNLLATVGAKVEIGNDADRLNRIKHSHIFFNILEHQIRTKQVQRLINTKNNFDLILVEAYFTPAVVFAHIFKAPCIQVSSFGAMLENFETMGIPTHPIFYPTPFRLRVHNLSILEKLKEYYFHGQLIYYKKISTIKENEMLQRVFGPNIPSIYEMVENVDMLFLNIHPIWMDNTPVPPNVIFMGGLHQKPKKQLPEDLKLFLDSSKNGVLYVSFGSNIDPSILPQEKLKILIECFSKLPYDILFKWTHDKLPEKPQNIKISKWFPQSDVLRHPKVKAFLTQGGLQSTDEAITAGVPLVCIPMVADQWYNADKYEHFKIGLKLDLKTLTKAQLKNSIETVIRDKSYRENIVKLREQMIDQPQPPLQRALWWIEYVLRHGGARHLRSPAANMSWTDYNELELVSVLLTILFVVLLVLLYTLSLLWRFIPGHSSNKVKKS